jgi:hypothetical protein
MQNTLRYAVSALALSTALGLAAPALAAHHDGWGPPAAGSAPAGGGSSAGGSGPGPQSSGPSWTGPSGGSNNNAHVSGGGGFAPHAARVHMFAGGQNVSHFSGAQRQAWSHGHWWHGRHHGHDGWWWFAGGGWFFYPYAVYPYPDYVSGTADYEDGYYAGAAANNAWWYCDNPAGYYPYVQNCMVPWRPVNPPPPPQGGYGAPPGAGGYSPPPGSGGDQYGPPNGGPDDENGPPDDDQGGPNDGPPPGNPPPGH